MPGARSRPGPSSTVDALAALLAAGGSEAPFVIDVRQPSEYEAGHVPGSTHIGAGELPEKLDRLPRDRPIATICASGYRSSVAASMLRAAGFEDVAPVANGLPTWEAHGFPVEYGPEAGSVDWPGRDRRDCRRDPHTLGVEPPSADLDPEEPERDDPEQDDVEDDDQPDRRPGQHVRRSRPLRCAPISRASLTSRTMNTSTTGSRRPCRFCEAMITGSRSSPGISTISAPAASTNV